MSTVSLHVAAMPFPTRQGTQAAVSSMMDALAGSGAEAHLLAYGDAGAEREPAGDRPWMLHRAPAAPGRASLRSGPSLRKLVSDGLLVPRLRSLWGELGRPPVVAHHVEAAAACLAARVAPVIFYAHTALGPELPTYAPSMLGGLLSRAGEGLDAALCTRADAVAAVSPALRDLLAEHAEVDARYVPIPWVVPTTATADERERGRREVGAAPDDEVVLYAGNLDGYQGWERLVDAMHRVVAARPRARLLVATSSDTVPLVSRAVRAGVANRIVATPLGDEDVRRRLHAAADVVAVPRRTGGGLPVKLLEGMARAVPTVAAARATAGLELGGAAMVVADDDPDALANGILLALSAPDAAKDLASRGRAYVATDHHPAVFTTALASLIDTLG